jgi:putative hemolysin
MDYIWIYSGFAFVCFLLIIVLTGVEYAWLASNRLTIELKKKQGRGSGKILGSFFDQPERFWSATVIGFYLFLVCFCFLFSHISMRLMDYLPADLRKYAENYYYVSMLVDFAVCSFLVLLAIGFFGKKIFERNPEGKLNTWTGFIDALCNVITPLARLFTGISEFILKYLFNVRINKKETIFERINPEQFIRQSMQGHAGVEKMNKELFQRALQLTQVKVRRCITPRNEVTAVDIHTPVGDLRDKFVETKLSKIVVFDETLDNIVGYAHQLDLNKRPNTIQEILHPIPAVPETMSALDLIRLFTKERKSIAWVVDEFGGTAGFVTMGDVLEEIFGNIKDEYDIEEYTEKQIAENEYIFSGRLKIDYINEKYELDLPREDAETLSGFIIAGYEMIPRQKERIIIGKFEFEILLVTETRIETVKLKIFGR